MGKTKKIFSLFLAFLKIGLFTFGGGYAMIAIIERELVERKKWLCHEEFLDIIAISESTPGPIAINSATFIGYKVGKFWGAFFATLGVVIPSFVIIFVISLFFNQFLEIKLVEYAFRGIQACVSFLIVSAGIRMLKHIKPNFLNVTLIILTILCLVGFSLFSVNFSSVLFILLGGVVGITIYLVTYIKDRKKRINESENRCVGIKEKEESIKNNDTENEQTKEDK